MALSRILAEFSIQYESEYQSILMQQAKMKDTLEKLCELFLSKDHESECQRKSLERENNELKKMADGWKSQCESMEREMERWKEEINQRDRQQLLENTNMAKEVPHSHLKMNAELPRLSTDSGSFAKAPIQDKFTDKLEDVEVKIPVPDRNSVPKPEDIDTKVPVLDNSGAAIRDQPAHKLEDIDMKIPIEDNSGTVKIEKPDANLSVPDGFVDKLEVIDVKIPDGENNGAAKFEDIDMKKSVVKPEDIVVKLPVQDGFVKKLEDTDMKIPVRDNGFSPKLQDTSAAQEKPTPDPRLVQAGPDQDADIDGEALVGSPTHGQKRKHISSDTESTLTDLEGSPSQKLPAPAGLQVPSIRPEDPRQKKCARRSTGGRRWLY